MRSPFAALALFLACAHAHMGHPNPLHALRAFKPAPSIRQRIQSSLPHHPHQEPQPLQQQQQQQQQQPVPIEHDSAAADVDVMKIAGGSTAAEGVQLNSFFPIAKHERSKFWAMSGMMFFIVYIYTVLRDTKDALVVSHCGAEAITFLKVYGVLPAATGFMLLYSKLSNVLSKRKLFYVTAVPFLVFYLLFCFVLYPFGDVLHPTGDFSFGIKGLSFASKLIQNWTFSLYYIMAELFGSVGVSVLFWQLANDIIPVEQAKRFYPLFGQLANVAPIAAGATVMLSAKLASPTAADPFARSIQLTTAFITLSGICMLALYNRIMNLQAKELSSQPIFQQQRAKKIKPKLSMMESFKFLTSSPYLGYIAIMVIAYGLSINFTEVMWKAQVRQMYPDKTGYQQFMGLYSAIMGATTFFVIMFGSKVIRSLGWLIGAVSTPVLMGALAAPFFSFIIFGLHLGDPTVALATAVYVGLVQNVLSKAVKYALFDPTKEMAYIPLDQESKVKGKAAIDVLASRVGKSGGSFLQQVIVLLFGNVVSGAPAIAAMFYAVLAAWVTAAVRLGNLFTQKVALESEQNNAGNTSPVEANLNSTTGLTTGSPS